MKGQERNRVLAQAQQQTARPQVRARAQAIPAGVMRIGQAPVRLPEGGMGAAPGLRGRSVFDETVRGAGAAVQQVPIRMAPSPLMTERAQAAPTQAAPAVPARPRVMAMAQLGQEGGPQTVQERTSVERVINREMPPVGISRQEAAAIALALGPALEASTKALAEGVVCGNVDSFTVQDVRVIRDFLERFAAVARSDERSERLSAEDFSKIDEVLSCQTTYEQVSAARKERTTALLIGGVVVGAIVLVVVS